MSDACDLSACRWQVLSGFFFVFFNEKLSYLQSLCIELT